MSRTLRRLVLAFLLAAPVALADVPGSTDLDYLPRFARAEIVDYRVQEGAERIYPQSAIRRISGRLRVDGEIAAVGRLSVRTYELPAGHSSA